MTHHDAASLTIAQAARLRPIGDVSADLGINGEHVIPYGRFKAKIDLAALTNHAPSGRLVLVTAMTPTPHGEGKTTVTVGLTEALRREGTRAVAALRQPSMGPVLGIKGGGTGGGQAQVLPMEDINIHFTGDIAAVGAAHNLLAALIDNDLHHRGPARLDPARVRWRRCLDLNDRALRHVVVGLGGTANGVPREDGFDVTAASEVMAILCLARDRADLKQRLGRLLVGFDVDDAPVAADQLGAAGAMAVLLREALLPNLVQTVEGGPVLIHGGPFANIAHGASSVIATRLGLSYADVVVTEAGFGADLGAEKFFDIVCRDSGLWPQAVVLVATCRALRWHGDAEASAIDRPDLAAVGRGLANLQAHIDNVRAFGFEPVVALNRFAADSDQELAAIESFCSEGGVTCAVADPFSAGGVGCRALSQAVTTALEQGPHQPRFLYQPDESPAQKITAIARAMYGTADVTFAERAVGDLASIHRLKLDHLPVCIAKTQASLADDPSRRGRPRGHTLTVQHVDAAAGAGFLVAHAGTIMTMPGLPRQPAALGLDIDGSGTISGLF